MTVAPGPSLDEHLRLRGRPDCGSRLDCDLSAFTLPEFTSGVLAGAVLLVVGGLGIAIWRRRHGAEPAAVYGLLLLIGSAAAFWAVDRLLPWAVGSVCLLALGGLLADRVGAGLAVRVVVAAPGAALLASTPALRPLVPAWCLIVLGTVTALGAALASDMDRHHHRTALAPVCWAVSVVAVYETVPDTDLLLVLLPLSLLLGLLAWPVPLSRFGSGGAYGSVGLLMLTVVVGGRGRLSAVVGGAACLGLLALEPVARRLARRSVLDRLPRNRAAGVLVGFAQLSVVFVATRVAGTRLTVAGAALVSGLALGAALTVLVAAGRTDRAREAVPT